MTFTPFIPRARAIAAAVCLLPACFAAVHTTVAAQSSPTAAMKAYHQAAKSKDFKALQQLLSAEYLKVLKGAPVSMERMMEALTQDVPATLPEMRNEKIAGDAATLEVRNGRTKEWESVAFVKEQGAWKLALPKQQ